MVDESKIQWRRQRSEAGNFAGDSQQAVAVSAPLAVTLIAGAACSGSQLANHRASWEDRKRSEREAGGQRDRGRKLYQR